jgi:hypothetical protein
VGEGFVEKKVWNRRQVLFEEEGSGKRDGFRQI